jgi:uncharacterized protein YcaQ
MPCQSCYTLGMALTISRQVARRFLLRHQGLLPAHQDQSIDTVFNHLRLIQHDPLNPCGRNIDLVLQARLNNYHPGDYVDWLYRQHLGLEGFDKVMCVLPREDAGYLRFAADNLNGERRQFLDDHRPELDDFIAKIKYSGPVCSKDVKDSRRLPLGWNDNHWGAVALETLWRSGELVICGRKSGQRYYDVPENVLHHQVVQPTTERHIIRRLAAVGILPISGAGTGWLGMGLGRVLGLAIKQMVADSQLLQVEIVGIKAQYVIRVEDEDLLAKASRFKISDEMVFLAPLDNVLWDRQMIKSLFDFDYTWEVYTPAIKRKYGYYVLPILQGDRLVGRIEPVFKSGVLDVKGIWWEDGVDQAVVEQPLRKGLKRFSRYLKIEES